MKSKAWRWIITWVAISLLAVVCVATYRQQQSVRIVSPAEEAAVAEALLGEKLSGPRYFNATLGGIQEEGGPWIGVTEAIAQVPRIATVRKLSPGATQKLRRLIDQMTESHPYRSVGGERIDLPRLNLSLDSLEK